MPTANEALLAAIVRHQVDVLRFAKGEARAVAKILKAADDDLVAEIQRRTERGLSQLGTDRLEALLGEVRRQRERALQAAGGRIKEGLEGLAQHEGGFEADAIEGALPFDLELARVPDATLKAIASSPVRGVPVDGWLDGMTKADVNRLQAAVRLAAVEGHTPAQLAGRVRDEMGVTQRNAEALGRTAINHVSNAARQEVWKANSDIVDALRWTSTLDGRTSAVCRARDGELAPVGDSKLPEGQPALDPPDARPPAHFNCRSVMVPVIDGQAAVGDRPFVRDKRTPKSRRADFQAEARDRAGPAWKSMTKAQRDDAVRAVRDEWTAKNVGRVPAKTTYQDWLSKQPAAFQDEVLGRGKAALFRKGAPLDAFVDASGRELTLAQLKAEGVGQTLNVEQPAIGLKAKSYLQQGFDAPSVLDKIKAEFPDASTSAASIASYKSELKKAGLLGTAPKTAVGGYTAKTPAEVQGAIDYLEKALPEGVKKAVGGAWYQVVDDLSGPAYSHYKAGLGVQLSAKKLGSLPPAQIHQAAAHELGHLLHKQHGLPGAKDLDPGGAAGLKALASGLSAAGKKNYGYYLASHDELTAEIYAQALKPSAITSQGLVATEFTQVYGEAIEAAKRKLAEKFPAAAPQYAAGPPISGSGLVAGKPAGVTEYVKALAQQGMDNDSILAAVQAEFPAAKTTKASISSVKSVMKKKGELVAPGPGPVVHATNNTPKPTPAAVVQAPGPSTMSPADIAKQFGYLDDGGELKPSYTNWPHGQQLGYKKVALAMAQSGAGNKEVELALGKMFPKAGYNAKNIASWKVAWKKQGKLSTKAFEKDDVASMPPPTLKASSLGSHAKKGLILAEKMFASGATSQDVEQMLANHFGDWDSMKGQPLVYLAEYNAKAKKFTSMAGAQAVHAKPSPAAKASPAFAEKVDMTPIRPAVSPYDSWPPPPRFSEEQRAYALRRVVRETQLQTPRAALQAELKAAGIEPLTPTEYTVVREYTSSKFYEPLNKMLRRGDYADNLELQAVVDAGQSGLRKMASLDKYRHRGQVNRGTSLSTEDWEKFKRVYLPGEVVEEHAFLSASTASGFGGRIRFRIHSKTGVKVSSISHHPGEAEVLFMPGARFRLDTVRIGDHDTFVEMTEVTDF